MTRRGWIIGILVAALLVVSLYRAKYGARESRAEMGDLREQIAAVREDIDVLRNEFSHLSSPEWLSEYATRRLGMSPPRPDQIKTVDELARLAAAGADAQAVPNAEEGGRNER